MVAHEHDQSWRCTSSSYVSEMEVPCRRAHSLTSLNPRSLHSLAEPTKRATWYMQQQPQMYVTDHIRPYVVLAGAEKPVL